MTPLHDPEHRWINMLTAVFDRRTSAKAQLADTIFSRRDKYAT
jgi:hypothetical protein